MLSDGTMILIISGLIIFIPGSIVAAVILISKKNRTRKKNSYTGITEGRIDKIKIGSIHKSDVIYVSYSVNDVEYHIKETLKLRVEAIKVGSIPIGQRKTYKLGKIDVGDYVTVQYDEGNPRKAIISDNDGVITG